MTFWINGELKKDSSAIAINDRGFLLGDGLFETFYVDNGYACEVDEHLDRLNQSLNILDISCPYSKAELKHAIQSCLSANEINFGSLRLTVSRGTGPRGLLPPNDCHSTTLITCAKGHIKRNEFPAINLTISKIRRNETSPTSRLKTIGGYLDNILALKEAKDAGFDDAILLNTKDKIACTTSANIFLKIDDAWHTPPKEDGILPGIYRDITIHKLKVEKQVILEHCLSLSDLDIADKILISNSLIGLREVSSVNINKI
ncbi:aminotransferase class IV [Curvivirga sp.]|uniref:aminotransferase class IV n=1 Tax=Curvivirga sp. TaxID=2856848 RepID=UPI003B5CA188